MTAVASLGIPSSGIRYIAEAAGRDDLGAVARAACVLRRLTIGLGLLGALAMAALAPLLSSITFGTRAYALPLQVLAASIFLTVVFDGQMAVLQGLRRVGDFARVNVIGAAAGTLAGVPLVWFWGVSGLVPFLLTVSVAALAASWWFVRCLPLPAASVSWRETLRDSSPLFRLGFAFMASGLMTLGVAYLLRLIVLNRLGLEAAGHYQAAATLSSLYVGVVLTAMGTDFYPRLTAVAANRAAMTRMLNEQIEVGVLIAGPGILATLALAPLLITLFYSREFQPAVDVLRWQLLGDLFRVASWPFGYALLAQGRGTLFLGTELLANTLHALALWLGLRYFNLPGAGLGFLAAYVCYWLIMYISLRRAASFAYVPQTLRLMVLAPLAATLVTAIPTVATPGVAAFLSSAITVALAIFSIRSLLLLARTEHCAHLTNPFARYLAILFLVPHTRRNTSH